MRKNQQIGIVVLAMIGVLSVFGCENKEEAAPTTSQMQTETPKNLAKPEAQAGGGAGAKPVLDSPQ